MASFLILLRRREKSPQQQYKDIYIDLFIPIMIIIENTVRNIFILDY